MDRGTPNWRQNILSVITLMLIIVAFIGVATLVLNGLCANALRQKLPVYPGAVETWEGHNFLTTFGIGQTYIYLESEDSPAVVHEWYNRHTADLLRNRRDEGLLRFGQAAWNVEPQANGTGSQVVLHGVCLQ